MAKQLSSLDMHFLLKELKDLEKSRVDRIYNLGEGELYMQFHKAGIGKKILRIILGKAAFISEQKSSDEKPSHFCMVLRKHVEGKTLEEIGQITPERIIKFAFKSKDELKLLYVEFFGKGNAILCDNGNTIIEALIKQKFKDRTILPKHAYLHPRMQYNIFEIKKDDISNFIKSSNKDKLITALATELGLGGIYSEEVCLLSRIDKNTNPKKINEKEISAILASIKKIIGKKIDSQIIYRNGEAIDTVPVDLELYKGEDKKKFSSFNEVLDHYFTNEVKFILKKESKYQSQINEIKRIITEQEATISSLKSKEEDNRRKAELIYTNYGLVKQILQEILKAKEKYSWEEIRDRLKGHKIVKDVDLKEKNVMVEL